MDAILTLSNLLVLPFWALMLVLPRWRWTMRLLRSPLVAVPPAALYTVVGLPNLPTLVPAVLSPQLSDLATLLGTPLGATIAWAHFLTFDLLVGRWAYLDARQRDLSLWLTTPILITMLMFGPVGYLLYLAARWLVSRAPRQPAATAPAV